MKRFFIDYDCVDVDTIRCDLRLITKRLGKIMYRVYVTSPSHYHIIVICEEMNLLQIIATLAETSCDKQYIEIAKLKGAFFHRVGDKLEDGCVIAGPPVEVSI